MIRETLIATVGLLAANTPLLAQAGEPEPVQSASIPMWIVMVLAMLLAILIVIPSFKTSKRSHQD
jgi:hypothetical protein